MGMKKYESLKELYPEYVSLDQLRIICRIAKRSARYLIENGIIPAIDTGRKTWRYKIALDDVITYLRKREQWNDSMIPIGVVNSGKNRPKIIPQKNFASIMTDGNADEVADYFVYIYDDCPDDLTTADITAMTGLLKNTINRLIQKGELKSITIDRKYIVPKLYLLEFLTTKRFIEIRCSSDGFQNILRGFEIWKMTKSSQ